MKDKSMMILSIIQKHVKNLDFSKQNVEDEIKYLILLVIGNVLLGEGFENNIKDCMLPTENTQVTFSTLYLLGICSPNRI
jgi:putative Mn2+ efflux pump MntP